MSSFPAGSQWSKWDLHVHTPNSIEHDYGTGGGDPWENFMAGIEALSSEFKVIGINDYLFIDGYERVLHEQRKNKRMRNIALFLPVLEFRLDRFGGVGGSWSRVNYHVLFSNELSVDTIRSQFIAGLSRAYAVNHEHPGISWKSSLTRESLEDLGQQVIDSCPPDKKPSKSKLRVGFDSYNVLFDEVQKLINGPNFAGKVLTGVGISEWNDLRWNGGSIADKKSLVNSSDFILTSCADPDDCEKHRLALAKDRVNSYILDASDAHAVADAPSHPLGKCHTWIKAAPTFAGLRHALREYDNRVALCSVPDKKQLVATRRTYFLDSVTLGKVPGSTFPEVWFQATVPLNHDLVAIIGNKGNCKSALADAIGLAGNSQSETHFSFLNDKKFRQAKNNKASHFTVALTWADGSTSKTKRLSDSVVPPHDMVRYFPQSYFESLCTTLESSDSQLERELKAVIFRHIKPKDQLNLHTLDELIAHRTKEMQQRISSLRIKIQTLNRAIRAKERSVSAKARASHAEAIDLKKNEIAVHLKEKPKAMEKPDKKSDAAEQTRTAIDKMREQIAELKVKIKDDQKIAKDQTKVVTDCERVIAKLARIREEVDAAVNEVTPIIQSIGITEPIRSIVNLVIVTRPLELAKDNAQKLVDGSEKRIGNARSGNTKKIEDLLKDIEAQAKKLSLPQQKYQEHQKAVSEWTKVQEGLVGDADTPNTLIWLQQRTKDLEKAPDELTTLRAERRSIMERIILLSLEHLATLKSYYAPVQQFMQDDPIVAGANVDLSFDVSLVASGLRDNFLAYIDKATRSPFKGKEGFDLIDRLLSETNFDDSGRILGLIEAMEHQLYGGDAPPAGYEIDGVLRKGATSEEVLDYLTGLSYLQTSFSMKMHGKHLRELSQGEKGAALLIFYLLVDTDKRPIIIDQPEENLDNQTIFTLLVPCIKRAKRDRQIIMVTHNPNLAVVCDAEQVIHCSHEKSGSMAVTYTTGPLEDPQIGAFVVDVLEGTMPAFENRRSKYALRGG